MLTEMGYAPTVDYGLVSVDKKSIRDRINVLLSKREACEGGYLTPYIALEKARKVLASFHIHLPHVAFLEGKEGVTSFPIRQFGEVTGMTNDGQVKTKEDSGYFVYFRYYSYSGMYSVTCKIVDEEELESLLAQDERVINSNLNENADRKKSLKAKLLARLLAQKENIIQSNISKDLGIKVPSDTFDDTKATVLPEARGPSTYRHVYGNPKTGKKETNQERSDRAKSNLKAQGAYGKEAQEKELARRKENLKEAPEVKKNIDPKKVVKSNRAKDIFSALPMDAAVRGVKTRGYYKPKKLKKNVEVGAKDTYSTMNASFRTAAAKVRQDAAFRKINSPEQVKMPDSVKKIISDLSQKKVSPEEKHREYIKSLRTDYNERDIRDLLHKKRQADVEVASHDGGPGVWRRFAHKMTMRGIRKTAERLNIPKETIDLIIKESLLKLKHQHGE
jgi:hypothetical protein